MKHNYLGHNFIEYLNVENNSFEIRKYQCKNCKIIVFRDGSIYISRLSTVCRYKLIISSKPVVTNKPPLPGQNK